MDFKQILLFVGIGLLALVIILALLGYAAGLKRQLKLVGTMLILLILGWLVFGDVSNLMDYDGFGVEAIQSLLGVSGSQLSLWEVIVEYLKTVIPNGSELLVEGKETYELVYNIFSGILAAFGLMSITICILLLMPLIRLISWIINLILKDNKKQVAEVTNNGKKLPNTTLVLHGENSSNDAIFTTKINELPTPKKTKKRGYGALVGLLTGIFVVILLLAPISGIASVVGTADEDTRDLINELMGSDESNVSSKDSMADQLFDFVDSYYNSGIGKVVESSRYFFGDSFSSLLFDSAVKVTTDTQTIYLREELKVFIETINALNGKTDIKSISEKELIYALNELKNSKFLVEAMPTVIEFLYEEDNIKKAIADANQEAMFLQLRYGNWKSDISNIFDAIKCAYNLGVFEEDFNLLTMNPATLSTIVNFLGSTDIVTNALPVAIKVGLELDLVKNLIGNFEGTLDLAGVNWKAGLQNLVKIYDKFQDLEITEMEAFNDPVKLIQDIIVDEKKTVILEELLQLIPEGDIYNKVVTVIGNAAVNNILEKGEFADFANIININALTEMEWKEDIDKLYKVLKEFNSINGFSMNLKEIDLTSDEAIKSLKIIVENILSLNILGNDITKSTLLEKALVKFNLADALNLVDEDGKSVFDKAVWANEIEVIKTLIDVYHDFTKLEGVDINDLEIPFEKLLETDEFIEVAVKALETLIESDLVMGALNPVILKLTDGFTDSSLPDDETLIKDLLDSLGSEALVNEIIQLVDALKSAIKLGVFDVMKNGLQELNYELTDEMIVIVNSLFESKLFDGFEGRIIRVVLKLTNILDIPLGTLDKVNYQEDEQVRIVKFINKIAPILQDENFVLFDNNGNFVLDFKYLLSEENALILSDAFKILFGDYYLIDNNGVISDNFKKGSDLVAQLMPYIYDQILKDLIPDEFKEFADVAEISNLDADDFAHDLSALAYITGRALELDLKELLENENINIPGSLDNILLIINAIYNLEILQNKNETFAWIVNYTIDNVLKDEDFGNINVDDLRDVNWNDETNLLCDFIRQMVSFLEGNDLETLKEILAFIKDKGFIEADFLNIENVNEIISLFETVLSSDVLTAILPLGFDFGVSKIKNIIDLTEVYEDGFKGIELSADIQGVVNVLKIIVNETTLLEEYFEGLINCIPTTEVINKIIDIVFELNIVKGYEGDLATVLIEKYLPANFPVKAQAFDAQAISKDEWELSVTAIKEIVALVNNLLDENGLLKIADVMNFINNKSYLKHEYWTNDNLETIYEIVKNVADVEIVSNTFDEVLGYVIDNLVDNSGYDVSFLKVLTEDELVADVSVLGNVVKDVIEANLIEYLTDKTLSVIKTENLANIVNELSNMNLIVKCADDLFSFALNKAFELAKLNFEVSKDDYKDLVVKDDFKNLADIINSVGQVLENLEIVSLTDLFDFINANDFLNNDVINNENAKILADIITSVSDTELVKPLFGQLVDYAIEKFVPNLGIEFINKDMTKENWSQDIARLAEMLINVVDFGGIDILTGGSITYVDRRILKQFVNNLTGLNMVENSKSEITLFGTNYVLEKVLHIDPLAEDFFDFLDETDWNKDNETFAKMINDLADLIDYNYLYSISAVRDFINNKNYLTEGFIKDTNLQDIADAISSFFELNVIDAIFPTLVNFGVETLNKQSIDVSFLNNRLTTTMIQSDIHKLASIVLEAVDFGALEYVVDKTISDIDLKHINNALEYAKDLAILEEFSSDIFALGFNKLYSIIGIECSIFVEDFENVIVSEEFTKYQNIISDISLLLDNCKLETLDEILAFVKDQAFTSRQYVTVENTKVVTDILKTVSTSKLIEAVVLDFVELGVTKFENDKIKLGFLRLLHADEFMSDIYSFADILNDAANFGALDIIYDLKGEETLATIDYDLATMMIKKLLDTNIYQKCMPSILASYIPLFAPLIDNNLVEYETVNFDHDGQVLVTVLENVFNLLKANNLTGLKDILTVIKEKSYLSAQFINNENVLSVLDIVGLLNDFEVVNLIADGGLETIIKMINVDSLGIGAICDKLVGSEIIGDIDRVVSIGKDLVNFGTIDAYFYNKLDEINLDLIINAVNTLAESKILTAAYAEILEFGVNKLFGILNINDVVSANHFVDIDIKYELSQITLALTEVKTLLVDLNVSSLTEIKDLIADKAYMSAQYLNETNILTITNIVKPFTDMLLFKTLAPYLFDFAAQKVTSPLDLSFLVHKLGGNEIVADIKSLLETINLIVDFGALDIYFEYEIEAYEALILRQIVLNIVNLNLYREGRTNFLTFGINKALSVLGIDPLDEEVFASITNDEYHADQEGLLNICDNLVEFLNSNKILTYDDFVSLTNGTYNLADLYTEENVDLVVNILENLTSLHVVDAVYPSLLDYAVNLLNKKEIHFEFVKDITLDDINADVRQLATIAFNLVSFGIIDVISGKDISIDLSYIQNVLVAVNEMQIFAVGRDEILAFAYNQVFAAVGFGTRYTKDMFESINDQEFASDVERINKSLIVIQKILAHNNLLNISDIKALSGSNVKDLFDRFFSLVNIEYGLDIIEYLVDANSLVLAYSDIVNEIAMRVTSPIDLMFLYDGLTNEEIQNDIKVLTDICHDAILFGAYDIYKNIELEILDYELLPEIVLKLKNLNTLVKFADEFVSFGLTKVLATQDVVVDASDFADFTSDTWMAEIDSLAKAVTYACNVLEAKGYISTTSIKQLFYEKLYLNEEFYTDEVIDNAMLCYNEILSLETVNVVFDDLLNIATNIASEKGYDLSFLRGNVEAADLANDHQTLGTLVKSLRDSKVLTFIFTKEFTLEFINELSNAPVLINTLALVDSFQADWSALATEVIASKLNLTLSLEKEDFAAINFDADAEILKEIIEKIHLLYNESSISIRDNIDQLVAGKFNISNQYLTNDTAVILVNVLDILTDLGTANVIIPAVLPEYVSSKQPDFGFIFNGETNENINASIKLLIDGLKDIVLFGLVENYYDDTTLFDYEKIDYIKEAINSILDMPILVNDEEKLIEVVLEKILNVSTDSLIVDYDLTSVKNSISAILDEAVVLLKTYGLESLLDFKVFNIKDSLLDDRTQSGVDLVLNILDVLKEEQLFISIATSLSDILVNNKYSKFAGLLDLNEIYPNKTDFVEDFNSLIEVIRAINSVDVVGMINGTVDFPYENRELFNTVITKLFNLHYLNNDSRIAEIATAVGNIIGADLSFVNGEGVNLTNDAILFEDVYMYLSYVLTDSEFPIKNKNDLNNKFSLDFFKRKFIFDNLYYAVTSLTETTLFNEYSGAFAYLLIPTLKFVAPEYYYALELNNYTISNALDDSTYLLAIIEDLLSLDFTHMGQIEIANIKDLPTNLVNNLTATNLFSGKLNRLFDLLVRDLVYGKEILGVVFEEGDLDILNVSIESDLRILARMFELVSEILLKEDVLNLSQAKNFVTKLNVKNILDATYNNDRIEEILSLSTELSSLDRNIAVIYEVLIKELIERKNLSGLVDYSGSTNQEFMEELHRFAELFSIANEAGLAGILSQNDINYNQADLVARALEIIADSLYFETSLDLLINKFSDKFTGFKMYELSADKLDPRADASYLALAYSKLIPILISDDFMFKTLYSFNDPVSLRSLVELVNSYRDSLSGAYYELSQVSILPYFVPTVYDKVVGYVPTALEPIVSAMHVLTMSFEDIAEDVKNSAVVLENMLNANALDYVLTKNMLIPESETVINLVDGLHNINTLNKNYAEIYAACLGLVNVDPVKEEIDCQGIDFDGDKIKLTAAIDQIMQVIKSLDITFLRDINKPLNDYKAIIYNMNDEEYLNLADVLSQMIDMTFINEVTLVAARKVLNRVTLPAKLNSLNEVLDLELYNKESFNFDLEMLINIFTEFVNSGLVHNFVPSGRNTPIDYANEHVSEIVKNIFETNFMSLYGQEIVNVAGEIVGLDLSSYDNSLVDYARDAEQAKLAYQILADELLSLNDFPVKTVQEMINILKGQMKVNIRQFNDYSKLTAVVNALNALNDTTISAQLIKVGLNVFVAKAQIPGIRFFDPNELSNEFLTDDYMTVVNILRNAVDFVYNNGAASFVEFDSSIENTVSLELLLDEIYNLHLFEGKYSEIVLAGMKHFNIDTTSINLDSVEYGVELEYVKQVITEVLTIVNEYDLHTLRELVGYGKNLFNLLKTDKQQFIIELKLFVKVVNGERFVNILESLSASNAFDQVFIPTYNKFVSKFVKFNIKEYAYLTDYSVENLNSDMALLASAVRNIYDSKIIYAVLGKGSLNYDQVPYLENAILELTNMYVLDLKLDDIIRAVDELVAKYDLSDISVENVDLVHDGLILKDLVSLFFDAVKETNGFRITGFTLGQTYIIQNIKDIYAGLADLTIVDSVAPWAIRTFVGPQAEKLGTNQFTYYSDGQAIKLIDDLSDMFQALIDMGIFSNDGFDFTNTDAIDTIYNAIFSNVRFSSKFVSYVDKVVANVSKLGVVPFSYELLQLKTELNLIKTFVNDIKAFLDTHSTLKEDLSLLANSEIQNEIIAILNGGLASYVIDTLLMPVLRTAIFVVNEKYDNVLSTMDDVSSTQFVNETLRGVFEAIGCMDQIGVFNGNLVLTDPEPFKTILDFLIESPLVNQNLAEIFTLALNKLLKVDLKPSDFSDVNFVTEIKDLKQSVEHLANLVSIEGVSIDDFATITSSNDAMNKLSEVLDPLTDSKILEKVIDVILHKVFDNMPASLEMLNFFKEALSDETYTNKLAMEDLSKLSIIIKRLAQLGFFDGTIDYVADLKDLDIVVETMLGLHAIKGREVQFVKFLFTKVEGFDTKNIDFTGINWNNERYLLANLVRSAGMLLENPGFDISQIDYTTLVGELKIDFLDFIEKSILSAIGIQLFDEMISKITEIGADKVNFLEIDWTVELDSFIATFDKLLTLLSDKSFHMDNIQIGDFTEDIVKKFVEFFDVSLTNTAGKVFVETIITNIYTNEGITLDMTYVKWEDEHQLFITFIEDLLLMVIHDDFDLTNINVNAIKGELRRLTLEFFDSSMRSAIGRQLIPTIFGRIKTLDGIEINYSGVDYEVEPPYLVAMLDAMFDLVQFEGFDLNNFNIEDFRTNEEGSLRQLFLTYVDASSKSTFGQDIFPQIYEMYVKPSLSADYQGLIDLNTLPRNEWKAEFENLFTTYFLILDTGYNDGKFTGTYRQTAKLIELLFSIQSVENDKETWLEKVLSKITVPGVDGYTAKMHLIEDIDNEINAIKALILEMGNFAGGIDNKISDFDSNAVYQGNNEAGLITLFNSLIASDSLRYALVEIINQIITKYSSGNNDIKISKFVTEEYNTLRDMPNTGLTAEGVTEYNNFVKSYFDQAEVESLAKFNTSASQLEFDKGINLGTVDLVALESLLKSFNNTKTFTSTGLGGADGVIANYFKGSLPGVTTPFGNLPATASREEKDSEVEAVISVIKTTKSYNLVTQEGIGNLIEFISTVSSSNSTPVSNMLHVMNSSKIFRTILPELVYNSLVDSVDKAYAALRAQNPMLPEMTDEIRSNIFAKLNKDLFVWLESQLPVKQGSVDTMIRWSLNISIIINLIVDITPEKILGALQ